MLFEQIKNERKWRKVNQMMKSEMAKFEKLSSFYDSEQHHEANWMGYSLQCKDNTIMMKNEVHNN